MCNTCCGLLDGLHMLLLVAVEIGDAADATLLLIPLSSLLMLLPVDRITYLTVALNNELGISTCGDPKNVFGCEIQLVS